MPRLSSRLCLDAIKSAKAAGHLVGPELKREHKQRPEVVERVFRDLIFEHRRLGRGTGVKLVRISS
jgi:hypothetical protein